MSAPRTVRTRPVLLAIATLCAAALLSAACNQAPAQSSPPDDSARRSDGATPSVVAAAAAPAAAASTRPQAGETASQRNAAANTDLGAPPIEFEPRELNFGYITPNADAAGEFAMRNVGDKPLRILSGKPTCACTTATDVANAVIAPGEFITLRASLDGRTTTGERREGVRYFIEGYAQPAFFSLRAEVTMPVRAAPTILNLFRDRTGHVVVESLDNEPFSVLAANGAAPIHVDFDPDLDEPRSRYVLEWDLTGVPDDKLPAWWIIETDHPDCPLLDVWVRHSVNIDTNQRRRWYVRDRRFILGAVTPGSSYRIDATVENMPPGDNIYAVKSLSPYFEATLEGTQRNNQAVVCTVRIDLNRGVTDLVVGKVEFIGTTESSRIVVIGKVLE